MSLLSRGSQQCSYVSPPVFRRIFSIKYNCIVCLLSAVSEDSCSNRVPRNT